jgi:chemotaxis protein MotB
MANLNGEAPIQRIIKKKGGHGGHHGGAWKVAYADFVTAMMALFIVLWIMAQSQSIRQNVAQYFKNPGVLPGSTGVMDKSDVGGAMPAPGHSQELQTPAPSPEMMQVDKARLEETKKKIQEIIAQLPELEKMREQIRLEITEEGLRIDLMEKEENRFFEVGSAVINPQAQRIFGMIGKELGLLPNTLAVEGHTDSRPYGKTGYTNWELSADRANAARRLMESSGVKPGQVSEVRGYADRRLFNQNDPNDHRNRRVSVIVMYMGKDKGQGLPPDLLPKPGDKKGGAAPLQPITLPLPGKETAPAPPQQPATKPPAPQTPPVASPAPAPPEAKGKEETPPQKGEGKDKAPAPAPPGPKETKPEQPPLEKDLGLQKEFLKLLPQPPITPIK